MKLYFKNDNIMKQLNLLLILILALPIFSKGQNSEGQMNDKDRIAIGINFPDNLEIGASAERVLESKLQQMVSLNGIGSDGENTIFYLEPSIAILTSNVTGGTMPMKAIELECTVELKDNITGNSYGATSFALKGVGKSDAKAYIQALKRINPRSTQVRGFIDRSKVKILEFYNSQCGSILSKAEAMAAAGQASEAYCMLLSIPQISMECYYDCVELAKKIGKENDISKNACGGNVAPTEAQAPTTEYEADASDANITFQLNEKVSMNYVQYYIFGKKLILEFNIVNSDDEEFEFVLNQLTRNIRAFDNEGVEYSATKAIVGEESFTWNIQKTIIPDTPVKFEIEFEKPETVKLIEFNLYDNVYKVRDLIK